MPPPEFPPSHSSSGLDINAIRPLVKKITFFIPVKSIPCKSQNLGKMWGKTTRCRETIDPWLSWTCLWEELQPALGSETEGCSSGVCSCCCADARDASENQAALTADTSHGTPRMAAECRTVIQGAHFTEAEHLVITNNTELDIYVCFRTCKRHGLEARREGEA